MAGGVSEALSVLSAAIVPKGPSFVRRPEFSQELVREAQFNRSVALFFSNKLPMSQNLFLFAVLLSVSQYTELLLLCSMWLFREHAKVWWDARSEIQ